jgi:hypothetical protein
MHRVTGVRIVVLSAMAFVFPIAWFTGETMNVTAGGNQNAATPPPAVASQAEQTFDQAAALAELRKSIAGKEQAPAETVFKNIQMFKGMPAARVLRIMEMGFARSLGVNCTHCHIPGAWEKDDKPPKQIAREMWGMVNAINNQHLKQIKNLKSEQPVINCTTCHRGQTKPALNLPEAPRS